MLRRTGLVTDLVVQAARHPVRRVSSATAAAIEKRCCHRLGAPVFLARAMSCRWVGSLGIASHAGLEVLRSGPGDWRVASSLATPKFNCAHPQLAR